MASTLAGKSKISDFNSSISSYVPNTSAKYIAKITISTTCEVYAFVEATAISGPA